MAAKADFIMRPQDLRKGIASALGTAPAAILIDGIEVRTDVTPLFYVWGSSRGASFFAKVFPAAEYSTAPRMETPWDLSSHPTTLLGRARRGSRRSVRERTSFERSAALIMFLSSWKIRDRDERLSGRESMESGSTGRRSLDFSKESRATATKALVQAGNWLRQIHDSSLQTVLSVDMSQVFDTLREWTIAHPLHLGQGSSACFGSSCGGQESTGGDGGFDPSRHAHAWRFHAAEHDMEC